MSRLMLYSLGQPGGEGTAQSSVEDDESYALTTIYRCRAPIASLDCMEELNCPGTGTASDSSNQCASTPGAREQHTLASCIAAQRDNQLRGQGAPGIRYRNLGKSGLRVSNVGLGAWSSFETTSVDSTGARDSGEDIVCLAYESGINLFDLSEAHSGPRAELRLGEILARKQWNRSSYVVSTKVYWSPKSEARGLSRKHIVETVRASLARLRLGYIDIVLIHRVDPMCPMEELVRAMNYVVEQGWAMYWGTARWSPSEISEAYASCRQFNCIPPIVEQSEYHPFHRDKPELYMPELYNRIGIGMMVWSPMSLGMLPSSCADLPLVAARPTGLLRENSIRKSLSPGSPPAELEDEARRCADKLQLMCALARRLGGTFTQLTVAWTLKNEAVQCLLLGAGSAEQLAENLQGLQLVPRLSHDIMTEIESILQNRPHRPPIISTLQIR